MDPILSEAQAWLQAFNARGTGAESADGAVQLGLKCHERMMDTAEDSKERSIPFALAGAQLFFAAKRLDPNLPEWVEIHEEQCCRHSVVWIHQMVSSGHHVAREWLEMAISNLERLQTINPEAIAWAPTIDDELRRQLAGTLAPPIHEGCPTIAALICYYNDEDMLREQWTHGLWDDYDKIYLWDGPYQYADRHPLFAGPHQRLCDTEVGRSILEDQRVVYCWSLWADEAAKRISAYTAVESDVVVVHDVDEFFCLAKDSIASFWRSDAAVGSLLMENVYGCGAAACDDDYSGEELRALPRKWVIFKRQVMSPQRHIDYLWLVGIEQRPMSQQVLYEAPLCHASHLTGCRSSDGQDSKHAFYLSLALKDKASDRRLSMLQKLVDGGQLTRKDARQILLRSKAGYTGMPEPQSGIRLKTRWPNATVPEVIIQGIIDRGHKVSTGEYVLVNHIGLFAWIPARLESECLRISLEKSSRFTVQCWQWSLDQPAVLLWQREVLGVVLEAELHHHSGLLGWLVKIEACTVEGQSDLQAVKLQATAGHESSC